MSILILSFSHFYPKGNETYTFGEELNGLSKYAVSLYSVNKNILKHFIQLYDYFDPACSRTTTTGVIKFAFLVDGFMIFLNIQLVCT